MTATQFDSPDRMGKILLQAMEEILGRNGLNALLNLASLPDLSDRVSQHEYNQPLSFEAIGSLHTALEQFYGPHGGRGVALRIGRACFQHGLREFGDSCGLTDLSFRLLPLSARFVRSVSMLATLFNQHSQQQIRLEDQENALLWHIERCPLCWQRSTESPACQMAVGLLQELLSWVSGGKLYHVEETACIACGDSACTIRIAKTPLG